VTRSEIAALVCALLPFVVNIGDRSVQTIDGVERVRWDYNYAGVVLGVIALVVVYVGVRDLKEISASRRLLRTTRFSGRSCFWRSIRSQKALS